MYTDFLQSVLNGASEIALRLFSKVTSTTKEYDNNQVLTEADLEIGKFITQKLKDVYPGHNIIDEEAGVIDNKSEFTWVVDPVDGTSNFANGLPTYGVMLGLLKESNPIAGGIALPFFDEFYIAQEGQGCFCNSKRVSVTDEKDLLKSLVAYQIDGHQEEPKLTKDEVETLGTIVLGIRNLRTSSSVFDACMVAQGKYGAVLNRTSKIWDNVAQQIVIKESGGTYTDFDGNAIDYRNPLEKIDNNFTYIAGSPLLHKQLMDIIKS